MTHFTKRILPAVNAELEAACVATRQGDAAKAFKHLERAHVLGQASTVLHVRVHWRMFVWGLQQQSLREVLGQTLRLVGAATKTPFGLVPLGNTGGSNVSPVRPMPIPVQLQRLIDTARK
jgi:hypothetical protein